MDLEGQLESYIAAGYPKLAGLTANVFRELAQSTIQELGPRDASAAPEGSDSPGLNELLVITRELVSPESRMPLLRLVGSAKPGIVDRNHDSDALKGLSHYDPLPELEVPVAPMYVLVGIERGDEYRNVRPLDAKDAIVARGRSPLTIDEGISLATVAPELLVKNHCFMLAGSSRGDKRMPALWIADGAPKLGWCYDRNPHSWLGMASAVRRIKPAV